MKKVAFTCPVCRKPVERGSDDFPFCSARCRQIDLGNWADGSYSIPGEPAPEAVPEEDADPSIH